MPQPCRESEGLCWGEIDARQMEYASVILLAASGFYAFCLVRAPGRGARWRLAWLVVLLFCLIFIGEGISWG